MSKNVLAVIPARYQSARLAGKPLKDIAGKSLLQRVWEGTEDSKLITKRVIATDSDKIVEEAKAFDADVLMTSEDLMCGSERVYAASQILNDVDWDIVINVQGDMPFITGEVIDKVVSYLLENTDKFQMATVATPIFSEEEFLSKSSVKIATSGEGQALYFSRQPIPWPRDEVKPFITSGGKQCYGFHHYGLYVFTPEALKFYDNSDFSPLEDIEKLEQLRALEKGAKIGVCVLSPDFSDTFAEVNTEEELNVAIDMANKDS